MRPFTLTGDIPPGIPPFQLPPFSVTDKQKNVTYTLSDMSNVSDQFNYFLSDQFTDQRRSV